MPQDLGRIDWMPRKKVWRVIWYQGLKDIPKGDYNSRAIAYAKLHDLIIEKR